MEKSTKVQTNNKRKIRRKTDATETPSNLPVETSTDIVQTPENATIPQLQRFRAQQYLKWIKDVEKNSSTSKQFVDIMARELLYQCMGKRPVLNSQLQDTYTFKPETARRTLEMIARMDGVDGAASGQDDRDLSGYSVSIPNDGDRTLEALRILSDAGVLTGVYKDKNKVVDVETGGNS